MERQESFGEQLSRVKEMASDPGDTWDLSLNDQAALRAVLQERKELLAALKLARMWLANCWPIVELAGQKPLPVIEAAIKKAEGSTPVSAPHE